MIKPINIGNIKLKNNLLLAPLAGVTIQPFRIAIKKMGASLVHSEMISSFGLIYDSDKTKNMIDINEKERPFSVQLFGKDAKVFGEASKIAQGLGADIIDINMGCPSSKVVNGGSGSAILKDTKLVKDIVKQVVGNVSVPVTVKIRAGWDESSINAVEVGKIIESEGSKMITIHARTKSQKFGPKCDWSIIKELKQAVKIPVIGNGNVFSVYDAKAMFEQTGCDGIMIGRGSYINPWLFKQILEFYENGSYKDVTHNERIEFIIKFIKNLVEYCGDKGVIEARKFICWFSKGLPDSAKLRKACCQMTNADEMINHLSLISEQGVVAPSPGGLCPPGDGALKTAQ